MSKSRRTQQRHKHAWRHQTALDQFGFNKSQKQATTIDLTGDECITATLSIIADSSSPPEMMAIDLPAVSRTDLEPLPIIPRTRSASVLSEPLDDDSGSRFESEASGNSLTAPDKAPNQEEEMEEEMEMRLKGKEEVHNWDVLRTKIKTELRKKSKTLPLSRINQLMVLANFATLRLKGLSRIAASLEIAHQWHEGLGTWFARRVRALARHYQVFEELPIEKRGGNANARSWLHDESVKNRTMAWLTSQPTGKVTPCGLQSAVNTIIFPDLNISPKQPLSLRTARRWLLKLGWRRTVVRKGVYMDGHERDDVVKYRHEVFLPAMGKFEARMVRYEGPELNRVEPVLAPGERQIITQFHDECCFHANDAARSLWLKDGEQPLRKKSRGRLIHVSDFINEADGRLVLRNAEGEILRDARKIIYPGSQGDPWWDTDQLITQLKIAIEIFNLAHPDCQALFVLDQSSAHAALPHDALRAFDMNKSDGGKQRHQRDTIIPNSNPFEACRGRVQTMTTESGHPKGLKSVLEERGFDVSKLRAKCSPVCPFENKNCCMARLLSQQEDFINQPSMLETLIKDAGHECIFLPKFHCELNPIEMVRILLLLLSLLNSKSRSTGAGANIDTVKQTRPTLLMQSALHRNFLMPVPSKLSEGSSIVPGVS